MTSFTSPKNTGNILQGLAIFAFVASIFTSLPATAGPQLDLSRAEQIEFDQFAINLPKTGATDQNFLIDLSGTDHIKFDQFAIDPPETGGADKGFLRPKLTAASKKKTNKLEFTSLDRFILSLTEQDRSEPLSARYNLTGSIDYAGHEQPQLSRSNLLNSPFANLVARKLTGLFSY